jgi:uncharacterized protein YecE (DUF72 family)
LDRSAGTPVLLGAQGWNYGSWVGTFYPKGTKPAAMLETYARAFHTVEADSTAYAIPADPVVQSWRQRVPPGFVFAPKLPQEITHERRLQDVTVVLRKFLDRLRQLGDRLGPILVQLSPGFRATDGNRGLLRQFLAELPDEFRWAFEFRDAGWITPATMELLRSRNAALALVDGRWIRREMMMELAIEPTADFAYLRWIGADRRLTDFSHPQFDRSRELQSWADAIRKLTERVGTVFGYVNNYFEGHAPHSVRALQRLLGQEPVPPDALREQAELF